MAGGGAEERTGGPGAAEEGGAGHRRTRRCEESGWFSEPGCCSLQRSVWLPRGDLWRGWDVGRRGSGKGVDWGRVWGGDRWQE